MTVFDLAFALLFLTVAFSVLAAVIAALRGRRDRASRIWRRTAILLATYAVVLLGVSIASPQRVTTLKVNQCSDDWCIAADSVQRDTTENGVALAVRFSLSSRARRVSQREQFVVAYLRTADGHRIDALSDPAAVPFDTLLHPGETIRTWRRYVVPFPARGIGLVLTREGGFRFPGCCIIGDESSFLHKRTVIRLD